VTVSEAVLSTNQQPSAAHVLRSPAWAGQAFGLICHDRADALTLMRPE